MGYKTHVRELIGKTPMLRLKALEPHSGVELYAKLEFYNPGGSIKDRVGEHMVKVAEEQGLLSPGSVIVEATAGNTGLGLALAVLDKPYRLILTIPEKFSIEKITLLRALGAEVIVTEGALGMVGAIEKAKAIRDTLPQALSLMQFENPANPEVHFLETGPEIWEDMSQNLQYLVAGAGSGGTISGVSRFLKSKEPNLKTFVAEPKGSTMGGGEAGCYAIEGIGNHFIPETMDLNTVDGFISITDQEAFDMVKRLARETGLITGSSSGAAVAGALKLAKNLESGRIVVILPDRGDRYFSKGILE